MPHHLLTLWNPSYAADAMDAHLAVLLDWAGRWRRGEAPGELEHMPDYYRSQFADFWFRLWDIRRLVADDTPAVMEELKGETERMAQEHRPDDLDQTPRHDPAKPGPILDDDFGQSCGDEPAQPPGPAQGALARTHQPPASAPPPLRPAASLLNPTSDAQIPPRITKPGGPTRSHPSATGCWCPCPRHGDSGPTPPGG